MLLILIFFVIISISFIACKNSIFLHIQHHFHIFFVFFVFLQPYCQIVQQVMKSYKIKYFIVAVVVTLFVSCDSTKYKSSDRVEQRLIFQQYSIYFDQEKSVFWAKVCFTLNNPSGTSIKLAKGSKVFLNRNLLEGSFHDEKFYYSFQSDSKLPDHFEFQYINNDEDTLTNHFSMKTFEVENPNHTNWSKNSGVFLSYTGQIFGDDEALSCILFQNQEPVATIEIELSGKKSFFISPDYLSDIPEGKYNCRFVRSFSSSKITGMERGGNFECEYYSKMIPITLTN